MKARRVSPIVFSVIIPTYNRANLLDRPINSMLAQHFKNWELIIIDDGSTDDTKNLVHSYSDDRIKYFFKEHGERSAARNYGIEQAQGSYICFLDSDDSFPSGHLQVMFAYLSESGFPKKFILCPVEYLNQGGELLNIWNPPPVLETEQLIEYILTNNMVIPTVSMCLHSSLLEKTRFDVKFSLWEDTHLALRLLEGYRYSNIPESQVKSLVHDRSTVSKGLKLVDIDDIRKYGEAIRSLQKPPYANLFSNIDPQLFNNYWLAKYQMYAYQSWINGQRKLVFRILLEILYSDKRITTLYYILKMITKTLLFPFWKK